ncbi:MAG: hypothetical protein OXI96_00735 [Acidimicrobiaceae bacterium]|nr:hypothetical protein [Acidimicrobiaceae bacterium]
MSQAKTQKLANIPRIALIQALGEIRGNVAVDRFAKAAQAFKAERFKEARSLLVPLANDAANVADVRELYGLVCYRLRYFKAAIRELEAFRILSGSVEQHPVLADCYRALRRWADVEALWKELNSVLKAKSSEDIENHADTDDTTTSKSATRSEQQRISSEELLTEGRIVTAGARADRGDLATAIAMLENNWKLPTKPQFRHLRQAYALADFYDRAGRSPRARELFSWVEAHNPHLADVTDRVRILS